MGSPSPSIRRPACGSRPSADLAGRSVAISADVPALFDAPLAPHHRVIGLWAAAREEKPRRYTRHGARQRIEQVFSAAVAEILAPFALADLRVLAVIGETDDPPALAVVCDSVGQLDLGWIEKSNVLSDTLFGNVAPVGWRAAGYRALAETLPAVLPVFGYDELFDEVSAYYWDGATDDAGARQALMEWHGHEADDLDDMTLPSDMEARRPDWMTATASPLKQMPQGLRQALKQLRDTHAAVKTMAQGRNAWRVDRDHFDTYMPGLEDRSHLPPLTIVPFDHFARELDDVGRFGMEQGFDDVAGLCLLTDATAIDDWFASLKLGADFLLAAQALINLDPANPVKPQ